MKPFEQIVFQLISNSGSARSNAFEALEYSQENDLENAQKYLDLATKELLDAHKAQTSLIQSEARGEDIEINMLLIHAQDHLMTSMLAKDLIEKLVGMQKEINELRGRVMA